MGCQSLNHRLLWNDGTQETDQPAKIFRRSEDHVIVYVVPKVVKLTLLRLHSSTVSIILHQVSRFRSAISILKGRHSKKRMPRVRPEYSGTGTYAPTYMMRPSKDCHENVHRYRSREKFVAGDLNVAAVAA